VGVRQYHGLNTGGIEGKIPVPPPGLVTFALKQAAVEQQSPTLDRDQMLGAGYGLSRPVKSNLHEVTSIWCGDRTVPLPGVRCVL
jgi:hypothetical protein